jgi:sugar phosphate isomerase/epimerase
MEYGLSTRLFLAERLSSRLLDRILEAGFRQIEIFAAPEHLDYRDRHHVSDLAQWFSDLSVPLHSMHAPPYSEPGGLRRGGFPISISYTQRRLRIDSMDEIKRTLEVAEQLPFRYLVLHLGLDNEGFSLEKFDAAFTSLEHLRVFGKERGVNLLLENALGELNMSSRLMHFLAYTHLEDVAVCFDVGHAHLEGDAREALTAVRERTVAVHLHDNHGEKDEHLLPFHAPDGGIRWRPLIEDLIDASKSRSFCAFLELQDRGPEATNLARVREVVHKLEALEGERAQPK